MMKLYYYILVIVTMFVLVSCGKDELLCEADDGMALSSDTLLSKKYAMLHARLRCQYVSDLKRTYGVGYGYDATGKFANYDDVRDRIIELSELQKYDDNNNLVTITDDNSPRAFQHILEGKDSETLLKAMSVNAGLSADIGLFQAEVRMSYSSSDMKSDYYSFCTIQDGVTLVSRHLEPYDLAAIAKKDHSVLSPGFCRYIDEIHEYLDEGKLSAAESLREEMFETYGTHLIYHAELGGLLNFTSTIERRSIDSRKNLGVSAKMSFMSMCGMDVSTSDESSFTQSSSQQKCHITARGGDVKIVTKMLSLNDEDDKDKKRELCNEWYQSVCYDFDNDDSCNVELVGMKLIPVTDLIYDDVVKEYYDIMCDNVVDEADNSFPRVYNKCYAVIPTENLDLPTDNVQYTVTSNGEVIGEIDYEYINRSGYVVFYPALDGEVQHEGIGRNLVNDSIYVITWDFKDNPGNSEVYVNNIGTLRSVPYLYYNNGDVDFSPQSNVDYSHDIYTEKFGVTMWTDTNYSTFRCGPYTLATGCYATCEGLNNYDTVSKDIPQGYEVMTMSDISEMENFVSGHIPDSTDFFDSAKKWMLPDKTVFTFRVDNNRISTSAESGQWGLILCKRKNSFRYP